MRIFAATPFYLQGPGAVAQVGRIAQQHGKNPGLVIDPLACELLGAVLLGGFASMPPTCKFSGEVTDARIAPLANSLCQCDVIVAVGGGKALDAGKAVAFGLGLSVITVPTIASTDGPASRGIAIYGDDHRLLRVDQMPRNPVAVIVDTAVIASAPTRFLRAGIGDAIAKMFEAEGCWAGGGLTKHGTRPTHSARALARAAYAMLRDHAAAGVAAAMRNEVTEDLEATVEAAVLLSAMGFENGGLSLTHSVTRGLMNLRGARGGLHGEHVAYGTLVQIAAEGRPRTQLADVARFLQEVGLPTSLAQLGAKNLSHSELEGIVSATMASPHIANLATPMNEATLMAALELIEREADQGWPG